MTNWLLLSCACTRLARCWLDAVCSAAGQLLTDHTSLADTRITMTAMMTRLQRHSRNQSIAHSHQHTTRAEGRAPQTCTRHTFVTRISDIRVTHLGVCGAMQVGQAHNQWCNIGTCIAHSTHPQTCTSHGMLRDCQLCCIPAATTTSLMH